MYWDGLLCVPQLFLRRLTEHTKDKSSDTYYWVLMNLFICFQIVRSDLQELSDLDLGGAPYGYTPFCDSRKEMDGFRWDRLIIIINS